LNQSAWSALRINEQRFKADFDQLSQIGATASGGVHRPALSPAHLEARDWFRQKIVQAGLVFHQDGAGNHSAILPCGSPDAPAFLLGSHLDSVPNGGRFDGALGVLAALEALRCVQEAGLHLPVDLEAIDFTDEEGTLASFLGSFALAGRLTTDDLVALRGGREAFEAGLERAGLSRESILSARRNSRTLAGYLELHIEQGKRLEQAGKQIGIVSGIPGIGFYHLTFTGRADHAGTISMRDRLDAAQGASAFTLAVRQMLIEEFAECYANIGQARYEPGAFNIVPERAILSLEFRSLDPGQFEQLEKTLLRRARVEAERFGLGWEAEHLGKHEPAAMSQQAQKAISDAAAQLGLGTLALSSRAGHDAQIMASLCPAGMIFVPSAGGASHSAQEFTAWQDCVNGANVLLQAALRMAKLSGQAA
jgi:N-carbamoyl-L-amino-acid hydrolase